MNIRIGSGTDIHAFAENRPLILCGLTIEHSRGLLGHSDADVGLHALIDAVLGALAWGDIGSWFPDTDQKYKNIDSSILFKEVWAKVLEHGWSLSNCDLTFLLEKPKLRPHIDTMRARLAELFGAGLDQISVKATTGEKMGFVGREEGILAHAVVVLTK
jgi:2-C-methyl-D-erythritol 2,4-cyclodiphosphate synthase